MAIEIAPAANGRKLGVKPIFCFWEGYRGGGLKGCARNNPNANTNL